MRRVSLFESAYTFVVDWQGYEREIEVQFRINYPSAEITRHARLVGKFSKVERQIDLLVEERASNFAFRIVVDAKYRGRKIDVGDVEAFISSPAKHGEQPWSDTDRQVSWRKPPILAFAPNSEAVSASVETLEPDVLLL